VLVNGGAATSTVVKIKGSLASCSVSGVGGLFPPLVPSGTFSGTLAAPSNDCAALLAPQPLTGTLAFKWKADPTTPLAQQSSKLTITGIGVSGSSPQGFFTDPWGQFHLQLSLGSSAGTGAFTGAWAGSRGASCRTI
jgi:hypothetical protein